MRCVFQTAVLNKDGVYSFQQLSVEQTVAWLADGPEPIFRMPLIASVIETLTGKQIAARPGERVYLHTGDEALIMDFVSAGAYSDLPGYKRGIAAAQARPMSLAEVRESVRFGLLRKFARLDPYVLSMSQWDAGWRNRRWRYLVHEAVLTRFGIYQFGRIDLTEATAWLNEGRYRSQLRYDVTCKALELVTDCDVSMWGSYSQASLSMEVGDQALVAYCYPPGTIKPKPFEPYTGPLPVDHVRQHTNVNLLTRLSDEFPERNRGAFPAALKLPGETRVG